MQEQDMLNDLIVESREHLENIEPDLLELEEKGSLVSDELINRIFRAVHSIKGGFGFFGIETIVHLSHIMENVLARIRDKTINISSELTDALLKGIDKLRVLLDDVANCENISIGEECAYLKPFLDDIEGGSEKIAELVDSYDVVNRLHPQVQEEEFIESVRNGKYMYQISIDTQKNIVQKKRSYATLFAGWEKFGIIINCNPERSLLEDAQSSINEASVLFSTVLEPDLIGEAMEMPIDQIFAVNLSGYKKTLNSQQSSTTPSETTATTVESMQRPKEGKIKSDVRYETKIEDALRVKVALLNNLMNLAGELVLARNQLIQTMSRKLNESPDIEKRIEDGITLLSQTITKMDISTHNRIDTESLNTIVSTLQQHLKETFSIRMREMLGVNGILQNIDMVTTMLQESIMQTRMQPLSVVFSKFPRVIRDLAKKLGKNIELVQVGQDVELDKSIIELLSDPLTHLVRNCADHGIELPDMREKKSKDRTGMVTLKAYQEGGKVIIEINDDGAGVDPEVIKRHAIEKEVISREKADAMTAKELQLLIFAPGFSTAKNVTEVSGRGVGMDVVKTNIERLGGTVEVDSVVGKGTRVTMKLPLTLAIIPSLIVQVEKRRFAIPQVGLEEVVRIRAQDVTNKVERIHNAEVLRLRGKLLPLVRLAIVLDLVPTFIHPKTGERLADRRARWSDRRKNQEEEGEDSLIEQQESEAMEKRNGDKDRRKHIVNALKVVVLKLDNKLYGIVVDEVHDNEEIVVKPLPEYLKTIQCYSGATIMGDGKVAMILDPNGIASMAHLNFNDLEKEMDTEKKRMERQVKKKLEDVLLFTLGGAEHFAIDLASVSRIEKRSCKEIQYVGDKEFLNFDNMTLRLLRIERYLPIQQPHQELEHVFVIIPKNTKHPFGIITTQVEDTLQTEINLDNKSIHGVGIRGSTLLNGQLTIFLDVQSLMGIIENEFEQEGVRV